MVGEVPELLPGAAASTGPRPRGRGWLFSDHISAPTQLLQRGRDHVVADGGKRWDSRGTSTGFNGAATTWSRMGSRDRRSVDHPRASTGPRPRGRGWVPNVAAIGASVQLQRGRDHVVAD